MCVCGRELAKDAKTLDFIHGVFKETEIIEPIRAHSVYVHVCLCVIMSTLHQKTGLPAKCRHASVVWVDTCPQITCAEVGEGEGGREGEGGWGLP